jgi:hypothetical protein
MLASAIAVEGVSLWAECAMIPVCVELGRRSHPGVAAKGFSYFGRVLEMRIAPGAGRQLFDSGVKIIMGTDSGTPGFFHRDAVWREADALVRLAGMSPNEVILAATKHAAETLRWTRA